MAGPRKQRASSGSPASSSTVVTTSILAIAVANLPGGPGQFARVASAAATANSSQRPILRAISASLAITRTPPARQASRLNPDGTSYASAQIASAQSRRPAGTSRSAPRPAAAAARLSQIAPPPGLSPLTAPPVSPHCGPSAPPAHPPAHPPAPPAWPRCLAPPKRWPVPPKRWPARRPLAGTGAAAAGLAPAPPASTPPPALGQPAGSRSGTACPTSAPSAQPARTRAATATAPRTAPTALTAFAPKTQNVTSRRSLYIGRDLWST